MSASARGPRKAGDHLLHLRASLRAIAPLLRDPDYLEFKRSIGEKLTASELAILDAARAPQAAQGGET